MEKLSKAEIENLNTLAYNEFLTLLQEDQTIPASWKAVFIGSTIDSHKNALDKFEEIIDSEGGKDVTDK
jgi:hypothetical protein